MFNVLLVTLIVVERLGILKVAVGVEEADIRVVGKEIWLMFQVGCLNMGRYVFESYLII